MKLIDLLNKIANGEEVPKIILFNSYKYRFDKIDRVYKNIRGNSTLGTINELDLYLNEEIKILDDDYLEDTPKEDKKIEHINKVYDLTDFRIDYPIVAEMLKDVSMKQYEIIDRLNGEK